MIQDFFNYRLQIATILFGIGFYCSYVNDMLKTSDGIYTLAHTLAHCNHTWRTLHSAWLDPTGDKMLNDTNMTENIIYITVTS